MSTGALGQYGDARVRHVPGWTRPAMICVVVVGFALRLVQYLGSGALWLDELALAHNVLERSAWELVREPLMFHQVAPVGFLLAQKAIVSALGSSDWVLRSLPFAAAVASLLVFRRLAERTLEGVGPLVAVTLFATAVPLLFVATQAKQYSTDVLAAVLIMYFGAVLDARPSRRGLAVSAATGAMLVWVSQPALLVIGATGIVVLLRLVPRGELSRVAIVVAVWGVSALAAAAVAMSSVTSDVRAEMLAYWADGLPPASMREWLARRWPLDQIQYLVGVYGQASLRYPAPLLYVALGLAGALIAVGRRRFLGHVTMALALMIVGAAVSHQYPFTQRLALYVAPTGLLLIAAAVDGLWRWTARWSRRMAPATAMLVAPCLWPVWQAPPPYQLENVHPALEHLRAHHQPGDRIYVYYFAVYAFEFYAARYGFSDAYTAGACHRPDHREYLEEIDAFRGEPRVWVFFSHALPHLGDRDDLLSYLETIGRRLDRFPPAGAAGRPDVEMYLYDLSDPVRLARSAARRHPIVGALGPVPACGPAMVRP